MIQISDSNDRTSYERAMSFARRQLRALIERDPDFYPMYTDRGRLLGIRAAVFRETADVENKASSGKSVGDGERQRAVAVRNRRNFLQVESKDLC